MAEQTQTIATAVGQPEAIAAPAADRSAMLAIVSPAPRWWTLVLRLVVFPAARLEQRLFHLAGRGDPSAAGLPLIHFAHWDLTRRGRPAIVFQTTFNGDAGAYIDAFSIRVPMRMRALWGGAYGFPGPRPAGRFKRFIFERAVAPDHQFHAYPQASVRTIQGALGLRSAFDRFLTDVEQADDATLAERWDEFVDENAHRM